MLMDWWLVFLFLVVPICIRQGSYSRGLKGRRSPVHPSVGASHPVGLCSKETCLGVCCKCLIFIDCGAGTGVETAAQTECCYLRLLVLCGELVAGHAAQPSASLIVLIT